MYEIPELEKKIEELKGQIAQMTQERDDIQLRLHAIDHAYNEQQRMDTQISEDFKKLAALVDELKVQNQKLSEGMVDLIGAPSKVEFDAAMQTIRRQREFIRTLYTSRKARKGKGSTSAQSERENAPKVKSGGNAVGFKGNPCVYCDGLGYVHCNGGRPTAPCPNGCQ